MCELDVPAMVHVSAVANPVFYATGSHYLNADTTAFMQLLQADLFNDFPDLRLVIPHGGGAVPYHWGRFRGLADMLKRPPLEESVMSNVFFDTCVYHQPGINLLFEVVEPETILFGSEMVGAVRGIDPKQDTTSTTPAAVSTPSTCHPKAEPGSTNTTPAASTHVLGCRHEQSADCVILGMDMGAPHCVPLSSMNRVT
jgi:4-oxalmesaconate hydratase